MGNSTGNQNEALLFCLGVTATIVTYLMTNRRMLFTQTTEIESERFVVTRRQIDSQKLAEK
jgi:hypothetical protein